MITLGFVQGLVDIFGEGGTQLFCGRYVRPGFPNLGDCERMNCRESGGLRERTFIKNWALRTDNLSNFQTFGPKSELTIVIFSENY